MEGRHTDAFAVIAGVQRTQIADLKGGVRAFSLLQAYIVQCAIGIRLRVSLAHTAEYAGVHANARLRGELAQVSPEVGVKLLIALAAHVGRVKFVLGKDYLMDQRGTVAHHLTDAHRIHDLDGQRVFRMHPLDGL